MYKFVKKSKILKFGLIQVIHTEIAKKGGKIEVLKKFSTLST